MPELRHAPLLVTIPGQEITGIVLKAGNRTENFGGLHLQRPSQLFIRNVNVSDITGIVKAVLTVKGPLNQTGLLLSWDGAIVDKTTRVAADFENSKKQASVEGIEEPNPILPASSL